MSGHSEKELIDQTRRGDRQAYALLVERYAKPVFGICYGILGNAADAEDASQEALVKGFQGIGSCRNGESFGAWLGRIARNLCLDWIRRQKKHLEILHERVPPATAKETVSTADLEQALGQLPVDLRLPLILFYFDGQSPRAIAEKLELSHTTVYQRLREARQELHRRLTDGGDV